MRVKLADAVAPARLRCYAAVSLPCLIQIKAAAPPMDDNHGMTTTIDPVPRVVARTGWRDLVLPKEHGSWSLALEPVALGLLVAPSVAGGWLALATIAGFLCRRPLKITLCEPNPARSRAAFRTLAILASIAVGAFAGAVQTGYASWLGWIVPPVVIGGFFLTFDLHNHGREQVAEVMGAAAFSLIAGAIVAAGDRPAATVVAVLAIAIARSVPTVLFVRACIRGTKTGESHPGPALLTAFTAAVATFPAWRAGYVPLVVPIVFTVLFTRTLVPLLWPRRRLRARTLGIQEALLGALYVATIASAWPR